MQKLVGVAAVTSKAVATLYEMQKLVGVAAVTSKAVATLLLTAAVLQRASTG